MPIRPQHPDDIHIVVARYNEDISLFSRFNPHLHVYNKGNNDIHQDIDRSRIFNLPNLGRESGTYIYHILKNYNNLADYTIFTQGDPAPHICMGNNEEAMNTIEYYFSEVKDYKFKYICNHEEVVDINTLVHRGCGVFSTPIELGSPKNINKIINEINNWVRTNYPDEVSNSASLINDLNKVIQSGKESIFHWEFNDIVLKNKWFLTSSSAEKMRYFISSNFTYDEIIPLIKDGLTYGYGAIFIVEKERILQYSKNYWKRLYNSLQDVLPTSGWGCERLWKFLFGYKRINNYEKFNTFEGKIEFIDDDHLEIENEKKNNEKKNNEKSTNEKSSNEKSINNLLNNENNSGRNEYHEIRSEIDGLIEEIKDIADRILALKYRFKNA